MNFSEEGEQFVSVGAACDHLAEVLCEFLHSGGEIDAIRDMIIDITDRGNVRLIVPAIDIARPVPRAA